NPWRSSRRGRVEVGRRRSRGASHGAPVHIKKPASARGGFGERDNAGGSAPAASGQGGHGEHAQGGRERAGARLGDGRGGGHREGAAPAGGFLGVEFVV